MKKVGIIGCGWIFQNEHVLGYIATSNGIIHGFCDMSEQIANEARNLYVNGMQNRVQRATDPAEKKLCQLALECKIYTDFTKMLPNIDAVDICTPPQYHMKYAKIAAEAGKTVLCEKPLARHYLDAAEALASLNKVPFYIFTQVIYNPIFKKGKEIMESGLIGDIIRTRNCHATKDLDHTIEKEAFWTPLISGGGALMDIGPHAYSVMRYWLGKKYHLVSVKDTGSITRITERIIAGKPGFKVKVEDLGKLQIIWEDDAGHKITSDLEAYWGEAPKDVGFGLYHEVEGTKGTLYFPKIGLGDLFGVITGKICFKVKDKAGKITKIWVSNPKKHAESLIAIDEFVGGIESRSPAWYGEDMMILLGSGYLSKKQGGQAITPEDFKSYCKKVGGGVGSDAAVKVIKDLFAIE